MKKLFYSLLLSTLLLFAGCSDVYDDSEIKGKYDDLQEEVDDLREDVDEIKALLEAIDKNLFVESVEETVDGYIITLSDNSTIYIKHGKDGEQGEQGPQGESGANGDSFFQSVTQDEQFVYFTLADGTIITLPKGAALDIAFEESDLVVMSPSSTREIGYTVTSVTDKVTVEVTTSADIRAKVVAADASGKTGKLVITTGASIDEYSKVIVFVSNGEKVTMKSISFEQAGLEVSNDATLYAPAEGGNVTLTFLSNVECEVVIPEEAQEWISLAPTTRAMTERNIALQLAANEGYYRSAEVTVQSTDGKLAVAYTIEQEGILLEEIDPTQIPDNEIWYRTMDGQMLRDIESWELSDVKVLSHTYTNGIGIISCDEPILYIPENSFTVGKGQLIEIYFPNSIKTIEHSCCASQIHLKFIKLPENLEYLNSYAFINCSSLSEVTIPITVKYISPYAFNNCTNIKGFYGNSNFVTTDNKCLISPELNSIVAFAGIGLEEYHIPEGIEGILPKAMSTGTSLRSVYFPSTMKDVAGEAFRGCSQLENFYGYNVSEDNKGFVYNNALKCVTEILPERYTTPVGITIVAPYTFFQHPTANSITIGEDVTLIGGRTFSECPNLTEVILPSNLQRFGIDINITTNYDSRTWIWGGDTGSLLFENSPQLKSVYFRGYLPPMVNIPWLDLDRSDFKYGKNLTIYVPQETIKTYQNVPEWEYLSSYMVGHQYNDIGVAPRYLSEDYSIDGRVHTIQRATIGKGIDLVVLGDGFSDREIFDGTYREWCDKSVNAIFSEEPYKSHKEYFNIHLVDVVSMTEGYDDEYVRTAFGSYVIANNCGGDDYKVLDYVKKVVPEEQFDQATISVLLNIDAYAGTCYIFYPLPSFDNGWAISYSACNSNDEEFEGIIKHEVAGHCFPKLGDEYAYEYNMGIDYSEITEKLNERSEYGWWKNVDFTNDPAEVRWAHFLADERYASEGLGVFEGGLTYWSGVWRPSENSIMRYNTGGFNAPSREAIYYRIHKLAYGDSWEYDYEEFVEWDERNRTAAASAPRKVARIPMKQMEHTAPPVVVKKSWREVAQ